MSGKEARHRAEEVSTRTRESGWRPGKLSAGETVVVKVPLRDRVFLNGNGRARLCNNIDSKILISFSRLLGQHAMGCSGWRTS